MGKGRIKQWTLRDQTPNQYASEKTPVSDPSDTAYNAGSEVEPEKTKTVGDAAKVSKYFSCASAALLTAQASVNIANAAKAKEVGLSACSSIKAYAQGTMCGNQLLNKGASSTTTSLNHKKQANRGLASEKQPAYIQGAFACLGSATCIKETLDKENSKTLDIIKKTPVLFNHVIENMTKNPDRMALVKDIDKGDMHGFMEKMGTTEAPMVKEIIDELKKNPVLLKKGSAEAVKKTSVLKNSGIHEMPIVENKALTQEAVPNEEDLIYHPHISENIFHIVSERLKVQHLNLK